MPDNPLKSLAEHGQSLWLDNLSRPLVSEGRLAALVRDDGVKGVTSNPAIFKNSIVGSTAYDDQARTLAADGLSALQIYEQLAIKDVADAADVLRGVNDAADGSDGFVSLEVSPYLANDTQGTIDEALRLWKAVDRSNVMIKIPGTPEGVPAIEACLDRGVNINVTLLFSLDAHRAVIEAYLKAMESRHARGESLRVASVASFFLSRIDVKVDKMLDAMVAEGRKAEDARALAGRAAIANAKMAYQVWKEAFSGDRWERLREAGARVQKPLWASTSTKNPDYSDVKYVEPLIGPETINTMPEETVDAFRDHGTAATTVEDDLDGERRALDDLGRLGIDLDQVTDELVVEGVRKFVDPFDALLEALEEKRRVLAAG